MLGRGHVTRGHIGSDDRRTGDVDHRAETVVDQLEGGLDARAARGDAGEDLGDGLHGLGVGPDGELEPGARAGCGIGGRVSAADRAGLGHPRPSFSRKPRSPDVTSSPDSAA